MMEDDDSWVQDKWGPAACVLVRENPKVKGENIYCFFDHKV